MAAGVPVADGVPGVVPGVVVAAGTASGEHPVAAARARPATPPSRARREGGAVGVGGVVTPGPMAGAPERFGVPAIDALTSVR